jgi:protein transport protein SEC13
VWQVCWGHPKFGVILASCGYDRKVIVWKEAAKNVWEKIYVYEGHELSVNSLAFAPHDFGLILACASSDGHVSVLTYAEGKWDAQRFPAHQIGVNSISWAPAVAPGALLRSASAAGQPPVRRFATGGCDNLVKIWRYSPQDNQWRCEDKLKAHQDWVRDVAWSPNMGSTASVLASCSQDKTVVIWTQEDSSKGWEPRPLGAFNEVRSAPSPIPNVAPFLYTRVVHLSSLLFQWPASANVHSLLCFKKYFFLTFVSCTPGRVARVVVTDGQHPRGVIGRQ